MKTFQLVTIDCGKIVQLPIISLNIERLRSITVDVAVIELDSVVT